MTAIDLPGAAHLVLVDGVAYLDQETAVFTGMLEGWARQQRTRGLNANTIRGRAALVRRLYEFPEVGMVNGAAVQWPRVTASDDWRNWVNVHRGGAMAPWLLTTTDSSFLPAAARSPAIHVGNVAVRPRQARDRRTGT